MTNVLSKSLPTSKSPHTDEAILESLWAQFNSQFPTKEACFSGLLTELEGDHILRCRYCHNTDIWKDRSGRAIKCKVCKKKTFLTAKTFFDHSRHHRAWLAGIWLKERGVSISASRFQRLLGDIAYSSASAILKKIMLVVESAMENHFINAPSALFRPIISKRSRLTPAGEGPFAEQAEKENESEINCKSNANGETLESSETDDDKKKCLPSLNCKSLPSKKTYAEEQALERLEGAEYEVYDSLSIEPVSVDTLRERSALATKDLLSTLTILEIKGLATSIDGKTYVRCGGKQQIEGNRELVSSLSVEAHTTASIVSFVDFMRKFRGISRKYLQLYLADYWCYIDRARWTLGSLLRSCQRFRCIGTHEIRTYVSPLLVLISPAQQEWCSPAE